MERVTDFLCNKKSERAKLVPTWRSGWDSNPRAREDYLISSQARYDHFDTAPYMFTRCFPDVFSVQKGIWKELQNIQLFELLNPAWLLDFRRTKRTPIQKISSQAHYDHFDTLFYFI